MIESVVQSARRCLNLELMVSTILDLDNVLLVKFGGIQSKNYDVNYSDLKMKYFGCDFLIIGMNKKITGIKIKILPNILKILLSLTFRKKYEPFKKIE